MGTHVITESGVTARLSQQQLHYLHMAVFTGAHERGRALIVLDVDVRTAGQESFHHVHSAMTDSQHQPRLTSLHSQRQRDLPKLL